MNNDPDESAENIRMLLESAGAVVPADGTLVRVRAARHRPPGFDRQVWATMGHMGWLAILSGEASGGLGLGLREAVALCGVLGRGLVPEPVVSALFAARLAESAGALPGPALTGETVMVAAWQAHPLGLDPGAGVHWDGARLTGRKIAVDGGLGADLFVVTTAQGIALIPRDAAGLTIRGMGMHDGTFCAELTLDSVEAAPLACPDQDHILHQAMLLHAACLLGTSERAFDITLDYLRLRRQFDVAIGSFQALQHRASEIKIQLELARAAIAAAASALDAGQDAASLRMAILRARARVGGLARLIAREAVQMHGAIGYTDEADIGLFTRRAMVGAGQYGCDTALRSRFMDLRDAPAANRDAQP